MKGYIITIQQTSYFINNIQRDRVTGKFSYSLEELVDSNLKCNYDPMYNTASYRVRLRDTIMRRVKHLFGEQVARFYLLQDNNQLLEI